MKAKWMFLTGIIVLTMFVGISMARWNGDDNENGNGECDPDRLRDCVCDLLLDMNKDCYCDICGCDLYDYGDGDCVPPQDGTGEQNGKGDPNPNENGDEDGDGQQNGR